MFDVSKAEKDAGELLHLMSVINNRLESMTSYDFKLLSVDPELWQKAADQLKAASSKAFAIFRNCKELQP